VDPEHPVRGGGAAAARARADLTANPKVHPHEVVVLGGGPGGCAAATLLARRAHQVALVRPASTPAGELAESVPPSANKLLRELGLLDAVQSAGFQPNLGNTVWWSGGPRRSEPFPGGDRGVHVERRRLEDVLVRAAEAAGVRVYEGFSAREAREDAGGWTVACRGADGRALELGAPWLLDATGRRGFLARRVGREPDPGPATLALIGRFRRRGGWDAEDGHTLVESWAAGWAWSVPLDPEVRCFAAMVDGPLRAKGDPATAAPVDARAAMLTAIGNARNLGALISSAEPAGAVWACSASLYSASRYARLSRGGGMLLVGDAGSFIDPLSSFGVKKALSSGWLAGVAVHTALVDAPLTGVAADHFDAREREVWRAYRRTSVPFFEEAAAAYGSGYWRRRADAARAAAGGAASEGGAIDPDEIGAASVPEADVRRAFETLRGRDRLAAIPGATLRTLRGPAVDGHRITLQDHLASDAYPQGMRFARGVDLRRLVAAAPRHEDVAELWNAYNRGGVPVSLPDFVTALSIAFAAGFLDHQRS
jgi:flavin-dependent dehydrogenase